MKGAGLGQSENRARLPNYFLLLVKTRMIWTKVILQQDPLRTTIQAPQEFRLNTKSKNFSK